MSDPHDKWMVGLGVSAQSLQAGGVGRKPATVDLFPASVLQKAADASPGAPPAKPPPPAKDALARASDGRKFWQPAPVGAKPPPGVDRAWLEAFLRFYLAGPASPADASGATCSFNGATVKADAALDAADAQATLNGYAPDRSTAAGLLKRLLKEGADSAALGDQVGKDAAGKGDMTADIARLNALPMTQLLAALDRMKAAKTLEVFIDKLPNASMRMGAAITTVQGQFDDIAWQQTLPKLGEADLAAVMARAPAKIRRIGPGLAAGEKPDEPVEVEAVVAASKDGVEMQVKITAHSPLGKNIGETEATIHVGPDGKVSQLELNVTAFQQTLSDKGRRRRDHCHGQRRCDPRPRQGRHPHRARRPQRAGAGRARGAADARADPERRHREADRQLRYQRRHRDRRA